MDKIADIFGNKPEGPIDTLHVKRCRHCNKLGTLVRATLNDEPFVMCDKNLGGCSRAQ